MSSSINYIKQIDGLRCFAVISVMIFHLINPQAFYLSKFPFGFGVDLFYLISGFLITSILFKVKENETLSLGANLKNFYMRRTLKIFPIYYITIAFLYFIQFQNYQEVHYWVLTYTTNIWICLGKPYLGSYNHLWSLAVEEQFYLLWPLLILIVNKKYLKKLIVFTIISSLLFKGILYYLNGGWWSPAMNAFTLSCMDSLGLGALLAYFLKFERETYQKYCLNKWLFLSSFVLYFFTMMYPLFPSQVWIIAIFQNTLFSLLAFFILAPAVTDSYSGVTRFILENKFVVHIGKISYGMYLYHLFMPDFYNYLNSLGLFLNNTETFRIAFYFICCYLFSVTSWFLIEKPFLKLKDKFNYVKQQAIPA